MVTRSPSERAYYYECSYGKYRLSLHIPYSELVSLNLQDKIDPRVLEDYPDGVDLRVGETDYNDFQLIYGFRPESDPETVRSQFYAVYSSTKDWRKFHGSGLISAKDLDDMVNGIKERVKERAALMKISPDELRFMARSGAETPENALIRYRESRKRLKSEEKKLDAVLRRHAPEGIDASKTLREQGFKVEYTQGDSFDKVLYRIQLKGRSVR